VNAPFTMTRSQQRIEQLLALKRPLMAEEQDDLYKALHADYMWHWRQERAAKARRAAGRFVADEVRKEELRLLESVQREAGR